MSLLVGIAGKVAGGIVRLVSIFQTENRADQRLHHEEIIKQCLIIEDEAYKFTPPKFYHRLDAMGNDMEAVRLSGHSQAMETARKALRGKANADVSTKAYELYQSCLTVLMEHGKPGSTGSMELTGKVLSDIRDFRTAWHKQLRIKQK